MMNDSSHARSGSLIEKLDQAAAPLTKFDAFPKIPSAYKARSESRGFMTIFVTLLALLLMLNDIGEYIWGWPDYEFSVDTDKSPYLNINVDLVVNMPCQYLSVDLRDAIGDRLFLSGGLRRDGTIFDIGQATALKEHAEMLSATQAVAQSRKSRGFFDTLLSRNSKPQFKPTYKYEAAADACRIYGTLLVKKVTANLHVTTLGHGYASYEHVPHDKMNLSHVITEFSFGPYFPDMTQPLDNSFELAQDPFVAYQYFLHVVPTTYIAPRTSALRTHQYSVTHYTRVLDHGRGTPGIFFKFDLDPMSLTIHQRTTTLLELVIRCVGVLGGVFVCMGYAIRVTTKAVEVVTGSEGSGQGIVAAEASGAKAGLRAKWGGGELRSRKNLSLSQAQAGSSGWGIDTAGTPGSPYSSYAGSPNVGSAAYPPPSPYVGSPSLGAQGSPAGGNGLLPPLSAPGTPLMGFGPPPRSPVVTPAHANGNGSGYSNGHGNSTPHTNGGLSAYSAAATNGGSSAGGFGHLSVPGTPAYGLFPPTPNPANGGGSGFPSGSAPPSAGLGAAGPPKRIAKKDD